jgi:ribonucleoside-diphosphate reductase alpha chain
MGAKFVIKRNGQRVDFDENKVVNAINKAFGNVYMERPVEQNLDEARKAARSVAELINTTNKEEWNVEEIQDMVEKALMEQDASVAKCYILYRQKRTNVRAFKASLGIIDDDLKLPINSLMVLAARYLLKDENLKIVETPNQMFERVSRTVANSEKKYSKSQEQVDAIAKDFFHAMTTFRFMPNSPTLMNAGIPGGQLSACFVIPVGDSMEEIFDAVKYAAIIHKTGGGTGFAFSRLRPHNDVVKGSSGVSSGPIPFMKVFDFATEQVKQGGKRRGANMGILRVDHPDILDFIMLKENEGVLKNFNISVAITDEFMKALQDNKEYNLINPRNRKAVARLNARAVWNLIVTMAWKTGDPGLVFLDRINASFSNPVPAYGPVESTNPCVTGDTLISTAYGMYRADELARIGTPNMILVDGRFQAGNKQIAYPVTQTGVKPVVKLVTKEGFTLKLTKDHKVYSDSRGWVEAGLLKKGEKVRITSTGGAFGSLGVAEEGRVLGWLVGDGHINMGKENKRAVLSFYGNDMELAEPFVNDVNSVIRKSGSKNHINEVGVVTIQKRMVKTIASERLKEFALNWGLGEEKLKVPEKVFDSSESLQRGFLQGLFEADGTISVLEKSRRTIRLTSISERLLSEVQMLLLNFGIFSKIYKNRKKAGTKMLPGPNRLPKEYNVKALHELSIEGSNIVVFAARIGFLSERKNRKASDAVNSYTKGPYKEYFLATTTAIEDLGSEPVYDLTEPVTHSFVANGIVVHNCGEQPLYAFDACNLGSINLAMMVKKTDHHFEVDWDELKRVTRLGVRFLDDVIDANAYPLKQIEDVVQAIRRIGLGVMGWADMLIKLGINYNSNEALLLAEQVMSFISEQGRKMSHELADERGAFPAFKESLWYKLGYKPLRNSTVTTIAPTGTISIIAGGTSQGVEPIFSVVYLRNVHESLGYNLIEVNNEFERRSLENGYYSEELMKDLAGKVSIQDVEAIPVEERKLFVTAYDIAAEWHVKMQAAFQKYVDNGVSKTINFPNWATPQDIENSYKMAYQLGCKGITVYRDSSKNVQILQAVDKDKQQQIGDFTEMKKRHTENQEESKGITMAAIREGAGSYIMSSSSAVKCPDCGTAMVAASGCFTCTKCGHSECG